MYQHLFTPCPCPQLSPFFVFNFMTKIKTFFCSRSHFLLATWKVVWVYSEGNKLTYTEIMTLQMSTWTMDQFDCAVKYFSQPIHTFFCWYFCRSLSQLHQWFFSCCGAVVVSRTNRNIITSPSSQTKNHFFPNLDFPTWLAAREIFEIFLVAGISPVASGPVWPGSCTLHSLVTVNHQLSHATSHQHTICILKGEKLTMDHC